MFATNLKAVLKSKKITQKELAAFVNVKENTVSDWIKQGNSPKLEHLCRISELLEVSLDWLIANKDEINQAIPLTPYEQYVLENLRRLTLDQQIEFFNLSKLMWSDTSDNAIKPLQIPVYKEEINDIDIILKTKKSTVSIEETTTVEMKVYSLPASAGIGDYLGEEVFDIVSYDVNVIPAYADFGVIISGDSMLPRIRDRQVVWVRQQLRVEDGEIGIFSLNDKAYCKRLEIDYEEQKIWLVSLNPEYEPIGISEYDDLRTFGKVLL